MFISLLMVMYSIIEKTKALIKSSVNPEEQNEYAFPSCISTLHRTEAEESEDLKFFIYDILRVIKDPERNETLGDLNVIQEDSVQIIDSFGLDYKEIKVEFIPTIAHCNLATLIGLCIRTKLEKTLPKKYKVEICIKPGAHNTEASINKQINDKERAAAAMENPSLCEIVEDCIKELE